VPAQHQLAAIAVELQRSDDPRLSADGNRVDRVAVDREERAAVGLDEIGLVDAVLLDVGRRVVGARRVGRRGDRAGVRRRRRRRRLDDRLDRLLRDAVRRREMVLRVGDEPRARGERPQPLVVPGLRRGDGRDEAREEDRGERAADGYPPTLA
jgi:hypothetical protein